MSSNQVPDIVAAAKELAPLIHSAREESETMGRLPDTLVEALDKAGLFQMNLPRSMGGTESDPMTSLRAIEELSKADGSVGWCALISSNTLLTTGWLDVDVARDLLGPTPHVRASGSFRAEGVALRVSGGYQISGRWDFASGIDHANLLLCTCKLINEDGPLHTSAGFPQTRSFLVPKEAATVHDTWSVVGMCGTGSKDFEVSDVFVPEERSFSVAEPPREPGPLYNPRMFLTAAFALNAANALGIARCAMDAFVDLANQTSSTNADTLLRDRPEVQSAVGEAESIISGSRAYLVDAVGKAWKAISEGKSDPGCEVVQARLAITRAVRDSVRAVDLLFDAAGSNAVYRKHTLERSFRDIHVGVRHLAGLPSTFQSGGRAVMGLSPIGPGW